VLVANLNAERAKRPCTVELVLEANCIITFRDRLILFGIKHANFFEPFAKYGISYYLNGQLKNYRKQGLVSTYKTRTKRLGKWHYKIEVDLDLTSTQFTGILKELLSQLKGFGR
jgi:hypothetical protein